MEKIKQYRAVQTVSFEDFFNIVTDTGICKYCNSFNECCEAMGENNIEAISGNGCSAFDNSVDNLKKYFLLEQCVNKGT